MIHRWVNCLWRSLRQGAAWLLQRPYYLPAIGVFITAVLVIFVSRCLLSTLDLDKDKQMELKIRFPVEKKDAKKEGGGWGKPAPEAWKESVQQAIDRFKKEKEEFLDIRARQQAFLSTWAVANLLQGALAVSVLLVSIFTVVAFLPLRDRWRVLVGPAAVLAAAIALVVCVNLFGLVPLTMKGSTLTFLQDKIRDASGLSEKIQTLTDVGNISIIFVTFLTPVAVGVLLAKSAKSPKKRLEQFRYLMYMTAFLLVVGVVQVIYQYRWPCVLFDDDTNAQLVAQMATGAGLLVGGVFTAASALVFLPAGYLLERYEVAKTDTSSAGTKKNWLAEIGAVLAPVLAALPIGKLFDFIH